MARAARKTGRSRSERRMSTSRWQACRQTRRGWRRGLSTHAERSTRSPAWRRSGAKIAISSRPAAPRSASRTESANRTWNRAGSRRRTLTSGRSKRASSSSAIPTRRGSCPQCRPLAPSAATAHTWCSENFIHESRPTASTFAPTRPPARRRSSSERRLSAAGRVALRCSSAPSKTIPSSAPIPTETTRSATATIHED